MKVMCKIFHCDHRGDRYCCGFCPRRKKCKNPCLNNPSKCGQYFYKNDSGENRKVGSDGVN